MTQQGTACLACGHPLTRPPQKAQPSCTDSFKPPPLPARTRDFQQFLSGLKHRESRHFQFFNGKPLQFIVKKDDIFKSNTPGSTLDIKSRKNAQKCLFFCKKNISFFLFQFLLGLAKYEREHNFSFLSREEGERTEEQKSVLTMVISYDKNLKTITRNLLFPF